MIPLEVGEELCPKCLGDGWVEVGGKNHYIPTTCTICNGSGKLDWIEQIVGKKPIRSLYHDSGKHLKYPIFASVFIPGIDK